MKSKRFPRIGDWAKILPGNNGIIGTVVVKVTTEPPDDTAPNVIAYGVVKNDSSGQYSVGTVLTFFIKHHIEPLTREGVADFVDKEVESLEDRIDNLKAELNVKKAEANRLRNFASDEEAIAAELATVWEKDLPRTEKLRLIANTISLVGRV